MYIDSYGGYTVAHKHTEQQTLKNSCRQTKRATISEKIVADLSNELQMVKTQDRHTELKIVIK